MIFSPAAWPRKKTVLYDVDREEPPSSFVLKITENTQFIILQSQFLNSFLSWIDLSSENNR